MLRFNFIETREAELRKLVTPDLILSILLIVLLVVILQFQISKLNGQIEHLNREFARLKAEESRLKRIEEREKQLLKKKEILKRKLEIISELDRKRKVPAFLYYFGSRKNVISGVWLDSIDQKGKKLVLKGGSFNLKLISAFLANIEQNLGRVIFKNTKLVFEKVPGGEVKYYRFQFTVEMK